MACILYLKNYKLDRRIMIFLAAVLFFYLFGWFFFKKSHKES